MHETSMTMCCNCDSMGECVARLTTPMLIVAFYKWSPIVWKGQHWLGQRAWEVWYNKNYKYVSF